MKLFSKNFILLFFICTGSFILFWMYSTDNQNSDNTILLEKKIKETCTDYVTISLNELTPFQWEKVYFFSPYTPKEEIFKTIGFKVHGISETYNEGMMNIIFIHKNKVVCTISGYGNTFHMNSSKKVLFYEDKPRFIVTRTGKEEDNTRIKLEWYNDDLITQKTNHTISKNKVGIWNNKAEIKLGHNIVEKSANFIVSTDGIILGNVHYTEYKNNNSIENLVGSQSIYFYGYLNNDIAFCKMNPPANKLVKSFNLRFINERFLGQLSMAEKTNHLNGIYEFSEKHF